MIDSPEIAAAEISFSMAPIALKPVDAAKALGISERTLIHFVSLGQIPFIRIGKGGSHVSKRFLPQDLLEFAMARRIRIVRSQTPGLDGAATNPSQAGPQL
jgi:hypothetical protein